MVPLARSAFFTFEAMVILFTVFNDPKTSFIFVLELRFTHCAVISSEIILYAVIYRFYAFPLMLPICRLTVGTLISF